tara:strand:+ start:342 stop:482 length:141 start_codon:yes stop_codon:yes gene_type:complete
MSGNTLLIASLISISGFYMLTMLTGSMLPFIGTIIGCIGVAVAWEM